MLVNYRRLYCLFGRAMHSPYALFCHQSKIFNCGRKVGLLCASDTRMAGHVYAQVRMLRLKDALLATISLVAYKDLKLLGFAKKAEAYVQDADMWEATFVLQRCLFPMICVLRLGDKSACGGMSKIIYYVHKTDEAIRNSMELFRDLKYFRLSNPRDANDEDSAEEDEAMDEGMDNGMESDDDAVLHAEEDSDTEEIDTNMVVRQHLGEQILDFWNMRRQKLITPLSIAAWFCSPEEEIQKDVLAFGTGQDRMAIDGVIAKIFYPIRQEDMSKRFKPSGKSSKTFRPGGDKFIMVCQILSWRRNKRSRSHMCGTRFSRSRTHKSLDMLLAELLTFFPGKQTSVFLCRTGRKLMWVDN
jgi:hypothetical protein